MKYFWGRCKYLMIVLLLNSETVCSYTLEILEEYHVEIKGEGLSQKVYLPAGSELYSYGVVVLQSIECEEVRKLDIHQIERSYYLKVGDLYIPIVLNENVSFIQESEAELVNGVTYPVPSPPPFMPAATHSSTVLLVPPPMVSVIRVEDFQARALSVRLQQEVKQLELRNNELIMQQRAEQAEFDRLRAELRTADWHRVQAEFNNKALIDQVNFLQVQKDLSLYKAFVRAGKQTSQYFELVKELNIQRDQVKKMVSPEILESEQRKLEEQYQQECLRLRSEHEKEMDKAGVRAREELEEMRVVLCREYADLQREEKEALDKAYRELIKKLKKDTQQDKEKLQDRISTMKKDIIDQKILIKKNKILEREKKELMRKFENERSQIKLLKRDYSSRQKDAEKKIKETQQQLFDEQRTRQFLQKEKLQLEVNHDVLQQSIDVLNKKYDEVQRKLADNQKKVSANLKNGKDKNKSSDLNDQKSNIDDEQGQGAGASTEPYYSAIERKLLDQDHTLRRKEQNQKKHSKSSKKTEEPSYPKGTLEDNLKTILSFPEGSSDAAHVVAHFLQQLEHQINQCLGRGNQKEATNFLVMYLQVLQRFPDFILTHSPTTLLNQAFTCQPVQGCRGQWQEIRLKKDHSYMTLIKALLRIPIGFEDQWLAGLPKKISSPDDLLMLLQALLYSILTNNGNVLSHVLGMFPSPDHLVELLQESCTHPIESRIRSAKLARAIFSHLIYLQRVITHVLSLWSSDECNISLSSDDIMTLFNVLQELMDGGVKTVAIFIAEDKAVNKKAITHIPSWMLNAETQELEELWEKVLKKIRETNFEADSEAESEEEDEGILAKSQYLELIRELIRIKSQVPYISLEQLDPNGVLLQLGLQPDYIPANGLTMFHAIMMGENTAGASDIVAFIRILTGQMTEQNQALSIEDELAIPVQTLHSIMLSPQIEDMPVKLVAVQLLAAIEQENADYMISVNTLHLWEMITTVLKQPVLLIWTYTSMSNRQEIARLYSPRSDSYPVSMELRDVQAYLQQNTPPILIGLTYHIEPNSGAGYFHWFHIVPASGAGITNSPDIEGSASTVGSGNSSSGVAGNVEIAPGIPALRSVIIDQ